MDECCKKKIKEVFDDLEIAIKYDGLFTFDKTDLEQLKKKHLGGC